MEEKPRNHDIEDALNSDDIKGTKFQSKREQAKCILQFIKSKFSALDDWPGNDDGLLHKITHEVEKLRKLKTSKCEFDLNQWWQVFLLSADNAPVRSDEAPPIMECDDSNEADQSLSSIPSSTVKKPVVGRPSGSHKRLSDGTCKKTTNKTIDEIVELIAAKAEYHNSDPFTLLQLVNERCKLKWRNNMKTANSGNVPVADTCAMMYNLNLSSHQYQELRLFLMKYKFIIPPRNNNDIYKKSLLPNITTETIKTYCNIKDHITNTVSSLLVT